MSGSRLAYPRPKGLKSRCADHPSLRPKEPVDPVHRATLSRSSAWGSPAGELEPGYYCPPSPASANAPRRNCSTPRPTPSVSGPHQGHHPTCATTPAGCWIRAVSVPKFLNKGVIVSMRVTRKKLPANSSLPQDGRHHRHTVFSLNAGSASASEIVAGACLATRSAPRSCWRTHRQARFAQNIIPLRPGRSGLPAPTTVAPITRRPPPHSG